MYMAMCIRYLARFSLGLTSWIFIASYTQNVHFVDILRRPYRSLANRSTAST